VRLLSGIFWKFVRREGKRERGREGEREEGALGICTNLWGSVGILGEAYRRLGSLGILKKSKMLLDSL